MDPTDPIWEKRFNAEELYELRNYTVPVIPELPAPLEQFVESFEGKVSKSMKQNTRFFGINVRKIILGNFG